MGFLANLGAAIKRDTSIFAMLSAVTQADTSRIYEVRAEYGTYAAELRVRSFGARRARGDAEDLLRESRRQADATGIRYRRYWIEEIDTTGLWQPPPQPKPRDRYTTRVYPARCTGDRMMISGLPGANSASSGAASGVTTLPGKSSTLTCLRCKTK
jgi:hypothetical protein